MSFKRENAHLSISFCLILFFFLKSEDLIFLTFPQLVLSFKYKFRPSVRNAFFTGEIPLKRIFCSTLKLFTLNQYANDMRLKAIDLLWAALLFSFDLHIAVLLKFLNDS